MHCHQRLLPPAVLSFYDKELCMVQVFFVQIVRNRLKKRFTGPSVARKIS